MLTKLWIGLFLCLLNKAVQTIHTALFIPQRDFNCPGHCDDPLHLSFEALLHLHV